jgi:hypothetical protein
LGIEQSCYIYKYSQNYEDNQTKSKANKNTKTTQKTTKDYNPDTGSAVQTRHRTKQTLEKTKRAIMNAQSRDTDYIGHTRHWTKTKKKKEKNTTTDPTKYNAPVMLFI